MLANNVPVFLDTKSGWNEDQCEYINIVVRTARSSFISKSKQERKGKPSIDLVVESKYNRVLQLKQYKYVDYYTLSFILNGTGINPGIEYPLLILKEGFTITQYSGSNSTKSPVLLSYLGDISIEKKDTQYVLVFKKNDNDWPVDENNNRVQYSVYIEGIK